MEPISLAVITSAVTTLALEAARKATDQVVQDGWLQIKKWLGWTEEPKVSELPEKIARQLHSDEALALRIAEHLQKMPKSDSASYGLFVTNVKNLLVNHGTITKVTFR